MKRKIIALFLSMLCIFSVFSLPSVSAADYENVLTSEQIAVFNAGHGFLVYGKEEHKKAVPGSTVKIMTALLALEYFEGSLDTVVTVPSAALRGLEGSAVLNLKAEEQIPVIDLIHATLIAGMNDAANTLAFAIGGTMVGFVGKMNAKAKELGAFNTMYVDATGISSSSYTTAYDTAQIAAYAYENDLFMEICSKRAYSVPPTNIHQAVTIYTRNSFLTPQSDYYYKNAEGISTSYSSSAGAQLVCAASHGNDPYICVAFGSKKDENGTIGGYNDVKQLLSWASYNFAERKVLDKSQIICELPVRAGKDVAHVLVVPYASVYAFLDKDADLSQIKLSKQLYYDRLDAPVQKGDCVGTLTITLDGVPIGETPLIAKSNVRQSSSGKLLLLLESILTSKIFLIVLLLALPFLGIYVYRKVKHFKRKSGKPKNP